MSNVSRGPSASERVRASKIRTSIKAGATVSTDDAAWYADYESARESVAKERASAKGASHTRKVQYSEEESAAVGTGSAAAEAAAAGAMVKADGERLDSILTVGIAALKESNNVYGQLAKLMIKRSKNFESTLVRMMTAQAQLIDAVRTHALDAVEADARAIAAENKHGDGDSISKMVEELMPLLLAKLGK